MIPAVHNLTLGVAIVAVLGASAPASGAERVDWTTRGKSLQLTVYKPAPGTVVLGTILMGSGDVGWVGLAPAMSQYLAGQGYLVVGINVRQYLSVFTEGSAHLTPADVQRDYEEMARYLRGRDMLKGIVIVSGVSEGAALAVLAASAPANHSWIGGVVTMGLPPSAEIAWRWSDFVSWMTKKDADEPSFNPGDYLPSISPLPIVMIQSTKDEYVTAADARALEAAARQPKQQVLIKAANHRFTDRIPELQRELQAALAWVAGSGH